MSKNERVISDPEAAGWEFDPATGYWMWKGEEGTGGLWEQNGDDIYYSDGSVGIGTDDPKSTLHVDGSYISVTGGGTYGYLEPLGTSFQIGTSPSSTVKELTLATSGQTRMTVDASGNVGFGGEAAGWGSGQTTLEIIGKNSGNPTASGAISFKTQDATTGFATIYSPSGTLEFWTGSFADNQRRLVINNSGRVDITGSLYVNGTPKIGYSELITTLVTLRKATMDETQDIRESLRDAIDELVAGFEQEIATMPAPEPEVSTQDIPE